MNYVEGTNFDNRFLLKQFIGSGTFGEVWLAQDKVTDLEVAIKIYVSLDDQGLNDFKKEFQIAFELNHQNLLHANAMEVNMIDKRPYLVMPYCPQGSVSKKIGNISEEEVWIFIRDVSAGLNYLHSQNPAIIHQDIKPDNILISKNGDHVITDFGISKQVRNTLRRSAAAVMNSSTGSISYMGPERFSKRSMPIKASDIWSLGVTIYEIIVGDVPFAGMGGSLQKKGAEIPELPEEYSQDLNLLMQCCLALEPWDRPTAEQLCEYASNKVKGQSAVRTWSIPADVAAVNSYAAICKENPNNISDTAQETVQAKSESEVSAANLASTTSVNKTLPLGSSPIPSNPTEGFATINVMDAKTKFSNEKLVWISIIVAGLVLGLILGYFLL